jgi:hypothetical protein
MKVRKVPHCLTVLLALVPALLWAQAPAKPPVAGGDAPFEALARMECISLPADAARRAMRQFPKEDDLYAWLGAELEKEKSEVRLEKLALVKLRTGQRSKLEERAEVPYTTQFSASRIPQTIAIGTSLPAVPSVNVTNQVTPPAPVPEPPKPAVPAPPSGAKGDAGTAGTPGTGTVPVAPGSVPARLFPPWPYLPCIPTHFSTRNAGWTTEFEVAKPGDGKMIEVTMAPEFVRYSGEVCHVTSGEESQPVFDSSKFFTRFLTRPGRHTLAGTMNPGVNTGTPGGNTDNRTWLVFLTLSSTEEGPGPAVAAKNPVRAREVMLRFDLISLPPRAARRVLLDHPKEADLYESMDGALAREDSGASLEQTWVMRTLSGQRAKTDSTTGYPYAASVDPPQLPQSISIGTTTPLPALPAGEGKVFPPWPVTSPNVSNFTFRNLGSSTEIEVTVGEDGRTVDMILAPEISRLTALMPQGLLGEIKLPAIESRRMHIHLFAAAGQPTLAGTLNAPVGTGVPGGSMEDRVCLLFVTATLPE